MNRHASTTTLRMSDNDQLPSLNPAETAVVICKFQNDFATEGGKIYETVKEVMEVTNMKENSIHFVELARKAGCTICHCPISLEPVCSSVLLLYHRSCVDEDVFSHYSCNFAISLLGTKWSD